MDMQPCHIAPVLKPKMDGSVNLHTALGDQAAVAIEQLATHTDSLIASKLGAVGFSCTIACTLSFLFARNA